MAYDSSDKPGSTQPDRNPDPITGAPGSHPLGTGIGTGSGALTGAALGAIGGPVGAAIGLIAGGIAGAFVGHEAGEYNDPTEDYSKAGQKHADPVAATTNAIPTPTPSSVASKVTGSSSTGSGSTSTSRTAATGITTSNPANVASTGTAAVDAASGAPAVSHPSLDADDTEYYRTTHKTGGYTAAANADFDKDLVPAYGYGTEVSRHTAGTDATDFSTHENDLRAGWDHVKGTSKLTYDQAKPAIQDAYNRSLKLHEERLQVNKNRVQTGNVSLRKEIITEQKQIEVPVQREEVVITTRTLNEGATGEAIDETQTIRVPVSEERINVDKQVVATGEVSLDKKVINETKSVVDSVRKEVVKVDKTGDVKVNEETAASR